ncbi:MAG: cytochrome c [Pirellulaceae bacterium]|nr:cytochrome c [Pirellulaceae bacterium]
MQQALDEAQVALSEFFGTPDEPKLPDFLEGPAAQLVNLQRLQVAAGPVVLEQPGRGLFRRHCASCHGVTGNGRGPNAAISNPYPRDFRLGKFKFKSTPVGVKPLRSDLIYTISHGIAGTTMVPIKELTDNDIEMLADYVIYLSWRGEVERALLTAAEEIEFESQDADTVCNLYAPGSNGFESEQLPRVRQIITSVADKWLSATDQVLTVSDPGEIPISASLDQLHRATQSEQDTPLAASIERGRELFAQTCSKCHGPQGHGDGQNQDYDDWTKDWMARINLNPVSDQRLVGLMARGALPPRNIQPRDLREGIYRGGSAPEKLYLRIAYGIEGTPMPSVEGVISGQDVWHLVNFVRWLAEPDH